MRKYSFVHGVIASLALLAATPGLAKDDKPSFSIKTPIEKIAANSAARAVIDAELPGFTSHPMYEQFKTMSLDALDAMFPGAVPRERIDAVDKALRAIPADAAAAADAAKPADAAAVAAPAVAEAATPATTTTAIAGANPQR